MTTGPTPPEDHDPDRPPPPPGYGQPPPPAPGYQQPPPGYGQPPPPGPGYGGPPAGYGTNQPMRPDEEKLWAIGAHLGPLLLGFVAPLVVWLVFKDRSAFLDRHGKEALNFQIAYLVYFVVAAFSMIVLIGFLLLPVLAVAWVVLMVLAAVKASQFQDYRYPAIFRVIS